MKKDYNQLTPREKRIAVAKDILQQLKVGKYVASSGNYVANLNLDYDDDIQKNFQKIKECEVCMIGAAILSTTHFKNQLTAHDVSDVMNQGHAALVLLETVFSERERVMMEIAFEGYVTGHAKYNDLDDEEENRCVDFFNDTEKDQTQRMRAICRNIIKNGEFKP